MRDCAELVALLASLIAGWRLFVREWFCPNRALLPKRFPRRMAPLLTVANCCAPTVADG